MTGYIVQTISQQPSGVNAQANDAIMTERSGAPIHLTPEMIKEYVQNAIGNGVAITFGSTVPANTVGKQSDVFFDLDDGIVYQKTATAWEQKINFVTGAELSTAIAGFITQTTADGRYPLRTDANPYPQYALLTQLNADDSASPGWKLTLKTTATGTPTQGQVQFNNTTLASVTQILMHETDRNGATIANLMDLLSQTIRIQIQNEQGEDVYAYYSVNGAIVDNGVYRTIPVSFVSSPTTTTTLTQLAGASPNEITVMIYGGAASSSGGGASGIQYLFLDTDPPSGAGQIRTLQASLDVATSLSINSTDNQGRSATDITARLKNNALITIAKDANTWVRYLCTSDYGSGSVNVSVQAFLGTIANGDTVYLSIFSDAPSVSSGGGGGITWTEETGSDVNFNASITADFGIISNHTSTTVAQTLTLPTGTPAGRQRSVQGRGTAIWRVKGGAIFAPDGTQNTGVRRLSTHRYASVDLLSLGGDVWAIRNPVNLTGIELYAGNIDSRLADYSAALLAQGYSLTAQETNALNAYLASFDAILPWSNVVCFYPMLGSTLARGRINFVQPNDTTHYLADANATPVVWEANGVRLNGASFGLTVPKDMLTPRLTNTQFTTVLGNVRNATVNSSGQSIWNYGASSAANYSLIFYASTSPFLVLSAVDQLHDGSTSLNTNNTTTISSPTTGSWATRSATSGSQIANTVFKDGAVVASKNASRGVISPTAGTFYLLNSSNATPMNTGHMRSFMIISSSTSLTNTQIADLQSAENALHTALGRT